MIPFTDLWMVLSTFPNGPIRFSHENNFKWYATFSDTSFLMSIEHHSPPLNPMNYKVVPPSFFVYKPGSKLHANSPVGDPKYVRNTSNQLFSMDEHTRWALLD